MSIARPSAPARAGAPRGLPFIGTSRWRACSVLAVVAARLARTMATTGASFFRDPARVTPIREGTWCHPPTAGEPHRHAWCRRRARSRRAHHGAGCRLMSVFDCHVNRSPVTQDRAHRLSPRRLLNARPRQGSENNERIPSRRGRPRAHRGRADRRVDRAAGSSASCARARSVGAERRIGMIRFGSRVDVYCPMACGPGRRRPDRDPPARR